MNNNHLSTIRSFLVLFVLLATVSTGCVGVTQSEISKVRDPIEPTEMDRNQPIIVRPVKTDNIQFAGEETQNQKLAAREKSMIRDRLSAMIVEELKDYDFQAELDKGKAESNIIIEGDVNTLNRDTYVQLTNAFGMKTAPVSGAKMNMTIHIKSAPENELIANVDITGIYTGKDALERMLFDYDLEELLTNMAEKVAEHISEELES